MRITHNIISAIEGSNISLHNGDFTPVNDQGFHAHVAYCKINGTEKEHHFKVSDFFELTFFESGSGVHSVDALPYTINDGQVHISFPGQVQIWEVSNYSGHRLIFSRQFVKQHFAGISFLTSILEQFLVIRPEKETFSKLLLDLELLSREISGPEPDLSIFKLRAEIVFNYIQLHLNEQMSGNNNPFKQAHPMLDKLKELLDENYKYEKEVAFYAGKLFMTSSYLNKLCKRQWGTSAKKTIDNRITLEATRLLLSSKKIAIREIAGQLGFSNVSNFSRFFKSRTGYSPLMLSKQYAPLTL